ncbi:MAG: hypothetical protein AAFX50_24675, partial [Acidobacteriota bacterium]
DYPGRLETLRRLFEGGQRAQAIKTERVHSPAEVSALFAEWAEGGKGEGLVVRPEDGRIFKLKPIFTFDAAVIGFTEKNDEPEHVRSLLLAMLREDGQFQLVGSVGNLGTDALRSSLYADLKPTVVPSTYRFASSTGALYRFVEPTKVVEEKVTDIQAEDTSGRPVRRMVLELDSESGWSPLQLRSGISLIHPILSRVRDDKGVNATDVRASQILERVEVPELEQKVQKIVRPQSTVVRREVFTKTTKDKTAVRKLLVWETGKAEIDPDFPQALIFMAHALRQAGDLDRAVDAALRAAELTRGNPAATVALATTHAALGDVDRARWLLEKILEPKEKTFVPPTYLAQIYAALDERSLALSVLDRACHL